MKRTGTLFAAAIVAFSLIVSGCCTSSEISGTEFIRRVEAPIGSAISNRYIGASGTRAYLEHWSAVGLFGAQTTVQWTPLAELTPAVAQEIKSGKNPWSNLYPATQPAGAQRTKFQDYSTIE